MNAGVEATQERLPDADAFSQAHGCAVEKPGTGFTDLPGRMPGKRQAKPIANVTAKTLQGAIRENIATSVTTYTDENSAYTGIGNEYAGGHHTTCHSKREYARGEVHSNTIEGF